MRLQVVAAAAALACVASACPAAAAIRHGGPGGDPTEAYARYTREARVLLFCQAFDQNAVRERSCLSAQFLRLITEVGDPAHELPRIDAYAHTAGGFLESYCHIIMHTVGRRYGVAEKVKLVDLQHYLPRTNDPGCSAGFAHGLISALGPQIQKLGPRGAAAECHQAATRYERYSCIHGLGHAYMRTYFEALAPALASCRALGANDAPDCAQGVYHDYWLALEGLDNTRRPVGVVTSPRTLCGQQPAAFVRACWYRAFLELPPKRPVSSARDILAVCRGLTSLQLSACITGASVIAVGDAYQQVRICGGLRGGDAVSCIRGVVVPSVTSRPLTDQLRLIGGCSRLDRTAQRGCYEWLGKALAVVTNGTFVSQGCARLGSADARVACRRGAGAYEGPLETFS